MPRPSDGPPRRRQPTRPERERILIVTEGKKTEQIYLVGVQQSYRRPRELWRIAAGGGHPQSIVNKTDELLVEARRQRDPYDQVWWVFDVEHPVPHPGLDEIIAIAERRGYKCAISHPCFELWLVLHFRLHSAPMSSADAERQIRACGCGYADKSFVFADVWPHRTQAISNATTLDERQRSNYGRILDRNPWTSVHELIQVLINLGESGQ